MKRTRRLISAALISGTLITGSLVVVAPGPAGAAPVVTFTLLTEPLPTELAVGESAIIGVRVQSSEPFAMAIALSDAYYPGRGVSFNGSPAHPRDTSAELYLTITGRAPTAELAAVQDWPLDEDWPAGVAPVAVGVGARFPGGDVVGMRFPFAVTVA
ncbi:MAG TPA: hypothetical protein VM942_11025 [Acidimicrobiales bacterium]|nr:hypothetical protein [Acidimicrobiales bacterium]